MCAPELQSPDYDEVLYGCRLITGIKFTAYTSLSQIIYFYGCHLIIAKHLPLSIN
jgi:hypothetical protein